jgi:hypothetical protein
MRSGQGTSGDKGGEGVAEWAGRKGKLARRGVSGVTRSARGIRYNLEFPQRRKPAFI